MTPRRIFIDHATGEIVVSLKDKKSSYGEISLLNHWITGMLVLVLLTLGLAAEFMPYDDAEDLLIFWHSSLGLILIPLVAWRIAWRINQRFPSDEKSTKPELGLKRVVQILLLIAIGLQVITGPLYLWTEAEALPFFGLFSIPSPFAQEAEALHEAVEFVHKKVANPVFLILIGIHIAGSIKSSVFDKRDTFRNSDTE